MTTRIPDNNRNHGGRFLMGFIAGSAFGAGLTLCLAPRLASGLRQCVTESTSDLRNAASHGIQDVATRIADGLDRVADAADDLTERGEAVRDSVADAVSRGAHGVGRAAREVEQVAMASKTDHGVAVDDRGTDEGRYAQ